MIFDDATAADLVALNSLLAELVGSEADAEAMARSFAEIDSDPKVTVVACREEPGGDIMGTAMCIVCNDIVWECRPLMVVDNVVVAESARGKGVGRALMDEIESRAREGGCAFVSLISSSFRDDAHRFYESLGYGEDPVRGFRKML